MPRLTTRKQPSKTRRYPISKTTIKKTSSTKKIKTTTKPKAKKQTKPIYITKIETLLGYMKTHANSRQKTFNYNDKVAKKLNQLYVSINQEIKKKNPINSNLAKYLKQISVSLKGASKVPVTLRNNAPKLRSFLRELVKKDVTNYINTLKKSVESLQKEFTAMENKLKKEVGKAKTSRIQFKVDPSILRKEIALKNKFYQIRTKWFKRFNPMIQQAPKNIQQSIKTLKKQIETLEKTCQRTCNLVSRYAKPIKKSKPGFRSLTLFTKVQAKTMENKINQFQKNLENQASQSLEFIEQLRAIKQL